MTGRVVHFEIPYDDGERARSFYSDVFGWQLQEVPEMSYTLVETGPSGDQGPTEPGFIGGGMTQRGGTNTAPTIVIDVEDIDAALAKVEASGGKTLAPRLQVGEMGWAAYFADPEGNTVGLWQTA